MHMIQFRLYEKLLFLIGGLALNELSNLYTFIRSLKNDQVKLSNLISTVTRPFGHIQINLQPLSCPFYSI